MDFWLAAGLREEGEYCEREEGKEGIDCRFNF